MTKSEAINTLSAFLGKRDVAELTQNAISERYGFPMVDVFVLFGGSVLCGGDILAKAIQNHIAKKFIIVGGAGHTTQTLRDKMQKVIPELQTTDLPEAELFNSYINSLYNLSADYLETRSTNCRNNITLLLKLLETEQIPCKNIIIAQDAAMQLRMEAVLKKFRSDLTIINFATYSARVHEREKSLFFAEDIAGMWDMERYISLLLGEIPRLRDDTEGYGPNGKNYLVHVDIPNSVTEAFETLRTSYPNLIREANPEFAHIK